MNPPRTFDDMLLGRRGGCVHFALLTAAILTEAGFELRLVTEQPDVGHGHIWLEVFARTTDRSSVTYVVDTAGATFVKTYAETLREALRTRGSRAAEFYTSSSRAYYDIQ